MAAIASRDNLGQAKARGVADVAFHKKRGLRDRGHGQEHWVYRKLRNFRAGIEAGISCLKRAYGLARCTWRGLDHFKAYVWSSVVAYNLALFTRLKADLTPTRHRRCASARQTLARVGARLIVPNDTISSITGARQPAHDRRRALPAENKPL